MEKKNVAVETGSLSNSGGLSQADLDRLGLKDYSEDDMKGIRDIVLAAANNDTPAAQPAPKPAEEHPKAFSENPDAENSADPTIVQLSFLPGHGDDLNDLDLLADEIFDIDIGLSPAELAKIDDQNAADSILLGKELTSKQLQVLSRIDLADLFALIGAKPNDSIAKRLFNQLKNAPADLPTGTYRSLCWAVSFHSIDPSVYSYIDPDRFADHDKFFRLTASMLERNALGIELVDRKNFSDAEYLRLAEYAKKKSLLEKQRLIRLEKARTDEEYRGICRMLVLWSEDGGAFERIDAKRFNDQQGFFRLAAFSVRRNGLAITHLNRQNFTKKQYFSLAVTAYIQNPASLLQVDCDEKEASLIKLAAHVREQGISDEVNMPLADLSLDRIDP